MSRESREQRVSRAFVALADTCTDDFDPLALFQRLTDHCTSLLAADAAGVTMREAGGTLRTVAASSEDTGLRDLLRAENEAGHSAECHRTGRPVDVPRLAAAAERPAADTAADTATATDTATAAAGGTREVAALAVQSGFASLYAVPLRLHRHVLGAVTLFRARPGPLPPEDRHLAQALADVALLALVQWRDEPHGYAQVLTRLQSVVAAKATLDMAQGMIAEAGAVSFAEAAGKLLVYARQRGVRITGVAEALVGGELSPAAVLAVLDGRTGRAR